MKITVGQSASNLKESLQGQAFDNFLQKLDNLEDDALGVVLKNNTVGAILYIEFGGIEATESLGFPIAYGETIQFVETEVGDISLISDTVDTDVRIGIV